MAPSWSAIPREYGRPKTCYNRFVRWSDKGIWDKILKAVCAEMEGDIVMIDSSCVRVPQHAATGKKGDQKIVAWGVHAED